MSENDPKFVIKRDGTRVAFDRERIVTAIKQAGMGTGEFGEEDARNMAYEVMKVLRMRFAHDTPEIEQIQDIVEQVLISENYFKTARAYIVYREKRGVARGDKKVL